MTIQLTDGQQRAADMVQRLLKHDGSAYGVLTGYAGTGKTTLLKELARVHGEPLILTPTGKASLRVTEATDLPSSTIHRWLYKPSEHPKTGDVVWQKKPIDLIELPANCFVVIDEASMVGFNLWADVWALCSSLNVKVLLVGDKFQLGPVQPKGEVSFNALTDAETEFRAELTEVTRQALDNPILRASMMIRQGESQAMDAVTDILKGCGWSDVVPTFLGQPLLESKALIAHRNATRQSLNLAVRKAVGYQDEVITVGEPLLVLFNNYGLDRMNGEIVNFGGWEHAPGDHFVVKDRFKNLAVEMSFGVAKVEDGQALLSPQEVFARTEGMPERTIARNARDHAMYKFGYDKRLCPHHLNANFGYCLTAHKAQGSEWDNVVVVIEPSLQNPFSVAGAALDLHGCDAGPARKWSSPSHREELMTDLDTKISKLSPRPGDVVVVSVATEDVDYETVIKFRDKIKQRLPAGVDVMVLAPGGSHAKVMDFTQKELKLLGRCPKCLERMECSAAGMYCRDHGQV
jgi:exodeoxyribonuclease-5